MKAFWQDLAGGYVAHVVETPVCFPSLTLQCQWSHVRNHGVKFPLFKIFLIWALVSNASQRNLALGLNYASEQCIAICRIAENVYQEHFLGVKAACAWGWQPHHLHVPNVMKSGSLNLLEPSGPHWACYGTPLPLYVGYQVMMTKWFKRHWSSYIFWVSVAGERFL